MRNSKEIGRNKEVPPEVRNQSKISMFLWCLSIDYYFMINHLQKAIYRHYTLKYNLMTRKDCLFETGIRKKLKKRKTDKMKAARRFLWSDLKPFLLRCWSLYVSAVPLAPVFQSVFEIPAFFIYSTIQKIWRTNMRINKSLFRLQRPVNRQT